MLDIIPMHIDENNCLEDIIYSFANWINRNYIFMYAESWGFSFHLSGNKTMGQALNPGWGDNHIHY